MLSEKIKHYLEEETTAVLQEHQERYLSSLMSLGLEVDKNSSFIEFMTKYSDEFYGQDGMLMDVANDISTDFETSVTKHNWDNYGIAHNYISLFNLETEDLLLYNMENDSVILIESGKEDKFKTGVLKPQWKNFNSFLVHFFEISG